MLSNDKAKRSGWNNDDMENVANKAGRKVRAYIDNAGDELANVTDNVKSQIREKPVQSSIIALAIGFVLGGLLSR